MKIEVFPKPNWVLCTIGLLLLIATAFMTTMGAMGSGQASVYFHEIDTSSVFADQIDSVLFTIFNISKWILVFGSFSVMAIGFFTPDVINFYKNRWRGWVLEREARNKYFDERKMGEL